MTLTINGVPYEGDLAELHLILTVADGGECVGPCSLRVLGGGPLIIQGREGVQDGNGLLLDCVNALGPIPDDYRNLVPEDRARIVFLGVPCAETLQQVSFIRGGYH